MMDVKTNRTNTINWRGGFLWINAYYYDEYFGELYNTGNFGF